MNKIAEILKNYKKKKIDTGELQKYFKDYILFTDSIKEAVEKSLLAPVKKSDFNGRNPPLYNSYWILEKKLDNEEELIKEINTFPPEMDNNFYLKNLSVYKEDREIIRKLRDFFSNSESRKTLKIPFSINERSFQIFNDEKFISEKDKNILSRLKLDKEKLNYYNTPEPFFYYMPAGFIDHILIVENKDTFFTIKRSFQDRGDNLIDNISFKMLIYGEGRKIEGSAGFLNEITGFNTGKTEIYYSGDLDFEGINILTGLMNKFPEWNIKPFAYLYNKMIDLCKDPPDIRTSQTRCDIDQFLSFFDTLKADKIRNILDKNKYIPQEVLSYEFFRYYRG